MNGYDSKEEVLEVLLERVYWIMEELYQSGFDTVHDSTLEEMGQDQELDGQYGMSGLAELLKQILDGVGMRRHRIAGKEEDRMGEIYTRVNEYLYLGMEKIAYDRGWGYYCKAGGEEAQT